MTTLSTHVLDTMHGRPAAGVRLTLEDGSGIVLFSGETNADGRCPGMPEVSQGRYALTFAVAGYFAAAGVALSDPPFLDEVRIAFGVADTKDLSAHYHVPLLVSPFAYSTYRGS